MSQSRPITHCEPLALFEESTVVAEFVRERDDDNAYQSEAALEKAFIKQLQAQAYEYLPITSPVGKAQRHDFFRCGMGNLFQYLHCRKQ